MMDRAWIAQSDSDRDARTAAAIAESCIQLDRAHRMIAESRRLRVKTEVALAASRQALDDVNRILGR